jgi:hypothetical protein
MQGEGNTAVCQTLEKVWTFPCILSIISEMLLGKEKTLIISPN